MQGFENNVHAHGAQTSFCFEFSPISQVCQPPDSDPEKLQFPSLQTPAITCVCQIELPAGLAAEHIALHLGQNADFNDGRSWPAGSGTSGSEGS